MCTLAVFPHPRGGYLLVANRDELYARSEAIPPGRHRRDETPVVHPTDPDGGGTWIAANVHGVSTTLLNHYPDHSPAIEGEPTSRGQVVLAVSSAESIDRVYELFDERIAADLPQTRPFRLLAIEPGDGGDQRGLRITWDGRGYDSSRFSLPFAESTSGIRFEEIRARRLDQLQPLLESPGSVDFEDTVPFFSSHQPDRESSICVHREFSGTVSHTAIEVGPDEILFRYVDAPLCDAGEHHEVVLSRGAFDAE